MLLSDVLSYTDVLILCSLCWMEYFCVTVLIDNWFDVSISKLFHTFPLSYFIYICACIQSPSQSFSWTLQLLSIALIVSCDDNDNIMNAQFIISLAKLKGVSSIHPHLCQVRPGNVIGTVDVNTLDRTLVLNNQSRSWQNGGYYFYEDTLP